MKMTIKSTITICLFVLAAISMLSSQNYIRLTDASGFNTDAYQAKLEAAAAELERQASGQAPVPTSPDEADAEPLPVPPQG